MRPLKVSTPHNNMATTMSSSSSSSFPQRKHDVFVSFRGKDVRKDFIQYLLIRLNQEGFSYFYDDEREHSGKKIEDKILPAIHDARIALIVLSKNYADSWWCLEELVEILECNSKPNNLVVIPVFFGVEPAHVKELTSESKFGQAFERFCKNKEKDQQEKWKKALQEVKSFSGFKRDDFRIEPDLLDAIVQALHKKITPSRFLEPEEYIIGAYRLALDVIPLLKISQEDKDVRMIGISGTEGIGKTMVAKAIHNGILDEFECCIFLHELGRTEDTHFVRLLEKFLQNLRRTKVQLSPDNPAGYIAKIKAILRSRKTFLVLDGVTEKEQMEKLGIEGKRSFRDGSRILITTRDQDLLNDLKVDDRYNVEGLTQDEAFRLFCRHAFKMEEPKEGYEELSRYLAHYAGGHPSALKEWGSYFNTPPEKPWTMLSAELLENPEHVNSYVPKFREIFKEYPCKVVGRRNTDPWKDEGHEGVREVEVGVDSGGIKFITVEYGRNGSTQETVTHGTKGGETFTRTIKLDYPGEYLTYMSGCTKEDSGRTILQSLMFYTNRGKHKLIGTDEEGGKLSFPYTGHKIVGFRGTCNDSHLESIEAMYKRVAHTPIDYSDEVFGPFGGAGEKSWDSGDINGISVHYEHYISKIKFKVNDNTSSRPTYGGNDRKKTFKVKLETPYECITSFSGYFENTHDSRIIIKSLTFRTNKRILGPIGREEGKHFSSPSKAVKVTRFFGRTIDDYLESIGAEVEQYHTFESVGLFGCSDVSNWDDRDDNYTNVSELTVQFVQSKRFIRSIIFRYQLKNGRLSPPKEHLGIYDGTEHPQIETLRPGEYLTSMSGYYTEQGITSLTFETNKRTLEFIACEEEIQYSSPTFGTNKRPLECIARQKGIRFSSPMMGGKIVGFYGRSGEYLEAIGAYFELPSHLDSIKSIRPFGVAHEIPWNHSECKGVRKIVVHHNINISSIQFEYDDSGNQCRPPPYGDCTKDGLAQPTSISLDYPREYLTSISGSLQRDGAIQSLRFESNKNIYKTCGKKTEKCFWYPSTGSRITSFNGTWDPDNNTLSSIGVYVELIPRMYPFKTVGPPTKGSGGIPWDDGVHTDVRGFRISFGKAIKAIGIAYDNNGSFVSGSEHGMGYDNNGSFVLGLEPGKKGRDKYVEVLLDYPKERLLSIDVWVDEDGNTGQSIIHDLLIYTSEKTYGPFIPESRQKRDKPPFQIPSKERVGRIVGFFGRVGRYLHSIEARLEAYPD